MRNWAYLLFVFSISRISWAQSTNYQWWNERHGWDGISPFENYLQIEPGRMGPNALPTPDPVFYLWDSLNYLKTSVQSFFAPGDFTLAGEIRAYYHAGRRVAVAAHMVYGEYFSTSEEIRDFRVARTYEGKGWAVGDLYVETHWLIFRSQRRIPDISLRTGIKTASGNRLEDARFTDTPGYYFDVNFRKIVIKPLYHFQWYAMMGFYAYQTYRVDHKQNDAFLYGAGGRVQKNSNGLDVQLRGYAGYLNKYDKPLIFSISLFRQIDNHLAALRFQSGNRSWPFHSVALEVFFRFY